MGGPSEGDGQNPAAALWDVRCCSLCSPWRVGILRGALILTSWVTQPNEQWLCNVYEYNTVLTEYVKLWRCPWWIDMIMTMSSALEYYCFMLIQYCSIESWLPIPSCLVQFVRRVPTYCSVFSWGPLCRSAFCCANSVLGSRWMVFELYIASKIDVSPNRKQIILLITILNLFLKPSIARRCHSDQSWTMWRDCVIRLPQ